MTTVPDPSFLSVRPANSKGTKRDVLWNVIEPGDPYDIRKSAIASMPGRQVQSMTGKTELICLFQSAQIQRLNEYLQQYKVRYLQLERKQMDRHSYQIQIKELTQKLKDAEGIKIENEKLREFCKKLAAENQQIQNTRRSDTNLEKSYESALKKIQSLLNEIKTLQHQLESKNQNYYSELQAMKIAKDKEMQDLERQYESTHKVSTMNQINSLKMKYEGQIRTNEKEIQRLNETIKMRNLEIDDLVSKNRMIEQQLRSTSERADQVYDMQRKINFLSQQIQKSSSLNKDLNRMNSAHEMEKKDLERQRNRMRDEIRKYDAENRENRKIINEIQRNEIQLKKKTNSSIERYEEQVLEAASEIDRLSNILKVQGNESQRLKSDHEQLLYQISKLNIVEKQNVDLKNQLDQYKRLIASYENKQNMLQSQIERLKNLADQLTQKKKENLSLKNENENLKKNSVDAQINYQSKINSLKTEHQRQISYMVDKTDREVEDKVGQVVSQIERLKDILDKYKRQNETLRKKKIQMQGFIDEQERQGREMIRQQKRNIENLENLNHQLERQIYDLKEQNNRYSDFQNQARLLKRDHELLKEQLQRKQKKIREITENMYKLENNVRIKDNEILENNIKVKSLSQQHDEVKKNHQNANKKFENSQKENQSLRRKVASTQQTANFSLQQMQSKLQILEKQNKALKDEFRRQEQINKENNSFISSDYERKIKILEENLRSFEDKYIILVNQNKNLEEIINVRDEKIMKMSQYIDQEQKKGRKIFSQLANANETIEILRRQNQKAKYQINQNEKELNDYGEKVALLSPQIQRLNEVLRRKIDENNQNSGKAKNLISDNESLRQKLIQAETDIGLYMKEREELYRSIQDNEARINEYQNRFPQINQEIDRLQKIIYRRQESIRSLEQVVRVRDEQIKKLKRDIYETNNLRIQNERNLSELQMDITRLSQLNKHSKNEIELQRERCKELEQYIRELQENNDYSKQSLATENQRLRQELKEVYEKLTHEERKSKLMNDKIGTYDRNNEKIKKKQRKDNANRQYDIERIKFLEQENARLKKDKKKIENDEIAELRNQIEELTTANLDLQQYIKEISQQLENKKTESEKQREKILTYEEKMEQFEKKVQGKEFIPKENMRKVIKDLNNEAKKQHDFYEEELKRVKTNNKNKLKKLQEQAQETKTKFEEQKRKSTESTSQIQNLQRKVTRLTEQLSGVLNYSNKLEFQKQQVDKEYDELKYNYLDLQRQDLERRKIVEDLQHVLQTAMNQNRELKKKKSQLEELGYRIKQYEDKIRVLDPQLSDLLRENQSLKITILDKDKEISNLKKDKVGMTNNIRDLENVLEGLMKDYKSAEEKIQSLIGENKQLKYSCSQISETKEKLFKIQRERDTLNYNIKSMTDLLHNAKAENEELLKNNQQEYDESNRFKQDIEKKLSNYELTIRQLTSENEGYKRKIENLNYVQVKKEELENKVFDLEKQVDKLYQIVHEKTDEINMLRNETNLLKSDIDSLTFKNTNMERQLQLSFSNSGEKIKNYELNMNKLNEELNVLRKQNSDLSRQNMTEIAKKQNSISSLKEQIEMLNNIVKDKQKALTQLNERVKTLSQENRSVIEELEDFQSHLSQKTMCFQQDLGMLKGENQEMKKKTSNHEDLRKKTLDQNGTIQLLNSQLKKIRQELALKEEQIQRYQTENQETYQKYERASAQRDGETQKVLLEQNQYKRLLIEHQNVQEKIASYDSGLKNMMDQFQRLQQMVGKLKKDKESAYMKNQGLMNEIKRLKEENNMLKQRVEDLGISLSDEIALEKRIQEHMALLVVLFAEIESLRSRIADKEKEIQEVRRDSLTPLTL